MEILWKYNGNIMEKFKIDFFFPSKVHMNAPVIPPNASPNPIQIPIFNEIIGKFLPTNNQEFEIRFGSFKKNNKNFYNFVSNNEFQVFHRVQQVFDKENVPKTTTHTIDYSNNNVRKSINQDTQETSFLLKNKIKNNDDREYNLRFALATEETLPGNTFFDETNAFKREKHRTSYSLPIGHLDLTKVVQADQTFYEIELEITKNDIPQINEYILKILRLVQGNYYLIKNSVKTQVINEYKRLARLDPYKYPRFIGKQPVTLHKEHIPDLYKNKYSVTDKADGDRFLLIALGSSVYFIDNNIQKVFLTDLKYIGKNILIDGELVEKDGVKTYLAFDIVQSERNLTQRLILLKDIINGMYSSDLYKIDIKLFYTTDIYKNSVKIMENAENAEYGNDGLIFTPIDTEYSDKNLPIYKWKPAHLNTIDLFSKKTDNNTWELFVMGDKSDGEKPILFDISKLCGDKTGIVTHETRFDNPDFMTETVIEYNWDYKNKQFSPMRTRWDKTANKRKHGNFKSVACDIWKSINNLVELADLSNKSKTLIISKKSSSLPPKPQENESFCDKWNQSVVIDPLTKENIKNNIPLIKVYNDIYKNYDKYMDYTKDQLEAQAKTIHNDFVEIYTTIFKGKKPIDKDDFKEIWDNNFVINPINGSDMKSTPNLIQLYNAICKNYLKYYQEYILNPNINPIDKRPITQDALKNKLNQIFAKKYVKVEQANETNVVETINIDETLCNTWNKNRDIDPVSGMKLPVESDVFKLYDDFCKNEQLHCKKFKNNKNINPINDQKIKENGSTQKLLKKMCDFSDRCTIYDNIILRDHQLYTVKYIMNENVNRMLLFHSIGSGKTLTAVTIIRCISYKTPDTKFIIVTPKSLQENFKNQMKTVGVDIRNIHFYTHTRFTNLIKSEGPEFTRDSCIIIDEAHNFNTTLYNKGDKKDELFLDITPGGKFRTSLRTNTIFKDEGIKPRRLFRATNIAKYVFMLTATPISNRPGEFSNIHTILTNKELTYKDIYDRYVTTNVDISDLKKHISYFNNQDFSEYPTRTDIKVILPMDYEYYRLYSKIEHGKGSELGGTMFAGSGDLVQYFNGVRRAVNMIEKDTPSLKVRWIKNEICKRVKNKEKTLIYTNWIGFGINLIKKVLDDLQISYVEITGDSPMEYRKEAVERFNNDDNSIYIFIISGAGGEGIDLKGTRAVIIMEPHWHSEKLRQIIGRAIRFRSHSHLPESERNVTVYNLLLIKPELKDQYGISLHANNSIDIMMDEMMDKKNENVNFFYKQLQKTSIEYEKQPFEKEHIITPDYQIIKYDEFNIIDYCDYSYLGSLNPQDTIEETEEK